MDVTRQKQKELQDNFSWMQPVSNKPSIPNVCYTDIEGNPLGQEYWLGPGQCYPGYFTAEARTAPATALLESVNYSQTPNFGGDACHIGACREGSQLNASRWDNIPFGSLLALANSASTSTCSVSNNNGGFSYRANPWICYDFMGRHPYDFAVPQRPAHNPNPPPEMSSTFFSNKGFQFVSETPDNVTTSMPGKADEQSHRQEELKAGAGYDTNCHQSDKELSITDTGLSIAATSTPNEEKQNEKGEDHSMDTSKTPQLKVKRKRHRPKVIIQGNPGTQAPVTPKPAAAENSTTDVRRGRKKTALNGEPTTTPSGKRKYVRKKPVHDSTSPTAEVTGTSVDTETVELVKRSCRKVLDFDENEQAVDGSSNCNSVFPGFASTPQSGTTLPTDVGRGTDAMAQNGTDGEESTFIVHIGQGVEVMLGRMLDLSQSVDQMQKDYISSVQIQAQGKFVLDATNIPQKERPVSSEQNSKNRTQGRADILSQFEEWISQPSRNVSNCSTRGEEQDRNMTISLPMRPPDASLNNLAGIHYHSSASYPLESSAHFPAIGTKVRTAEVQYLSSSSKTSVAAPTNDELRVESTCQAHNFKSDALSFWTSVCHNASGHSSAPRNVYPCLQYDLQNTGNALPQTEKSKKRSRAQPKVRDLASLDKTLFSEAQPNKSVPHTSMEVVVAESCAPSAKKKRTKKSALITKEVQPYEIITFHQNSFSVASLGTRPELLCKQIVSVDMIAEQLQNLDIHRESSVAMSRVENSLVPYNLENNALTLYKDGTIVPFEPAKKRRPRAKVHLDEETSRVWRLLLENINNEGIDGTDEENTKYWEEERRVFTGRANSFTARMRLVQGDRRFSPWKGSVVDSVVGVFLTQNVSDHLSSSAFMSLAANFPLKERGRFNTCSEDSTSSVINKPIMHISDPDDVAKWSEEMTTQSFCNQSPRSLRDFELDDEREVVNSSELSESTSHVLASGTALDYCDSVADRSSTEILEIEGVLSSQNSVSPSVEAASRKESQSEDNSKTKDTTSGPELHNSNSCTFMELLRKAGCPMLNEVHSHENSSILSDKNTDDDYIKSGSMRNELQSQKTSNSDSPQSCLEDSVVTSSNCCSDPTYVSGLPEAESLKTTTDERTNHDIFMKKDQNSVKDDGAFVTESVGHKVTEHSEQVMIYQEASGSPITGNSLSTSIQEDEQQPVPSRSSNLQGHDSRGKSVVQSTNNEMDQKLKLPEGILDITESTSRNRENNPQEADASGSVENVQGNKELQGIEEAKRKAKSRRVGREIKDNVDWDAFRKQAEANGKKRERKENTMDSLDYEAVRAADVNEVANTIKERGMNNRLAARIKDMLDRLVREHGSVDLEWLRDIAPDQAKEFLLSIKGLGLKSVECVRLLTLHHVAFPVDTNVGRIVVRLGWVPLQPLPESLQLHLLELYPVLESIQQYLWPRLCKLDQKTLYELHYQMITFGKVFCTKSKPNCNACPMRGECRHFASAFASARLALPGPEEKSVVCTTQNNTTENNTSTGMPSVLVDSLPPLPLPQGAEQSALSKFSEILQTESKNRASNHEPIIEEPASPEPECAEVTDKDMEDMFTEDPDEIPTIKLNIEEFTQNLQNYMQENMELQEGAMSKALVALTAEVASIPVPKLKNMSQLRTEHQVYELPDSHPLLKELERREPDDPCTYLLAIWSPGETENSIYPPEKKCSSQECGSLCDEKTCYSCNSVREANSQIVRGTILIPCRTAMRGSFPLNGTYFQVNEVFADHESSLNPIDVPRSWIWNLPRRTVYFGTSVPSIFKGLTTEEIQQCFWRGYVCVRGFDRKSRAPRPLKARLHFPASKLKNRGKKPEE